jgi:hypothetical protein
LLEKAHDDRLNEFFKRLEFSADNLLIWWPGSPLGYPGISAWALARLKHIFHSQNG